MWRTEAAVFNSLNVAVLIKTVFLTRVGSLKLLKKAKHHGFRMVSCMCERVRAKLDKVGRRFHAGFNL